MSTTAQPPTPEPPAASSTSTPSMPLFHCHDQPPQKLIKRNNDYWEPQHLQNNYSMQQYLTSKGYSGTYNVSSNSTRLHYLCDRADNHLPVYDKLPVAQMRQLCLDKGLEIPNLDRKTKLAVKAELENLDDRLHPVGFGKFMDLPKELRLRVYDFYMEELHPFQIPPQPPISKVSKTIRKESLSIFYQACRFRVTFVICKPYVTPAEPVLLMPRIQTFFETAPVEVLHSIRKMEVEGLVVGNTKPYHDATGWRFALGEDAWLTFLPRYHEERFGRLANVDEVKEELEKRVDTFVEKLKGRGDRLRLERDNIDEMMELFDKVESREV